MKPIFTSFSRVVWVLFLTLSSTSVFAAAQPEYRAMWIDAFGSDFKSPGAVTMMMENVRAANLNVIVPEIRKRGDAYYNGSPYEPKATDVPPDFDPLQAMLDAAHDTTDGKQRIDVYGWIVSFKVWSGQFTEPPTNTTPLHPYTLHKDWLTRDPSGATWDGTSYSFDPGHPEVQQYTYDLCMDMISRYDLDGFNFDYIRYTGNTWGYHPITVERFNRRFGRTGLPQPTDPLWMQFRRDQVTAVVRKVYLNAIAIKPRIKISADTITWGAAGVANEDQWYSSAAAWRDVLQDWRGWMEEGILDINIPMNYYRVHQYPWAYTNWMNFAKEHKYNRHLVVGPGIYLNYTSNAITQMRATRELSPNGAAADGVCGYVYKQPDNQGTSFPVFKDYLTSSPNEFDPFSPALFGERADLPVMPWKVSPANGHLKGFVRDSSGQPIDGAKVVVSGPVTRAQTNDATGFYGFVDLPPGAYTIAASYPAYFSGDTNVTITAGPVMTRDFVLSLKGPPAFVSEPESQDVYNGGAAAFGGWASGVQPVTYKWLFRGALLQGKTGPILSLPIAGTNDAGEYQLVASNSYGSITSRVASLTVTLPFSSERVTPLWQIPPGSQPFLTSAGTERGMAYNKKSGRLLIVNRTTPAVHVLDANTGTKLHTLDTGGVWGGYTSAYYLLMIGVDDDGVVYAGNLTLSPASVPFRIYRFDFDEIGTPGVQIWEGDPLPGSPQRWGDTFAVRGAETNTQILIGSRSGNSAVVFTTTDGINFEPRPITISGAPNGAFGLGIVFGQGNTFWGKATGQALVHCSFDVATGTGSVLESFGAPGVPSSIGPIGVSSNFTKLAGISFETPDNLQMFELKPSELGLIATNAFPTDNDNTTGTGSVAFGGDRVFALNSANGLIALRILDPVAPSISSHPASKTVNKGQTATFNVSAIGTGPIQYQWYFNNAIIPGATNAACGVGPLTITNQGAYRAWVTNVAGGVFSDAAQLTVALPPSPTAAPNLVGRQPDSSFQVGWNVAPGFGYVVESSTNLTHWVKVWTNLAGLDGTETSFAYKDWDATNKPASYFRLKDWP